MGAHVVERHRRAGESGRHGKRGHFRDSLNGKDGELFCFGNQRRPIGDAERVT